VNGETALTNRKGRVWASGVALALAAALGFLLLPRKHEPSPNGASDGHAPASTPAVFAAARPPHAVAPAAAESEPPSAMPVIEAAYLDKTEVCRGEQNFVNVEAYTENGTDPYLSILVTDPDTGRLERGPRVAFRQERASTEPIQIVVKGFGAERTVELPPPTIKDCDEPVAVQIEVARSFGAPDRVALTATIREPESSAGAFTPYEFVWDFADGDTLVESSGRVEHSYENRIQDARVSSFIVSVTARERGGRSASGFRTVSFSNFGFLMRELDDKIQIQVGTKSTPEAGSDADRLWLYHGHDKLVRLTHVRMRELEGDSTAGREVERADYSPAQALGFSELGPKQRLDVAGLAKLAPTRPGTLRLYDVEGRSEDGKLAHARFVVGPRLPPEGGADVPHVTIPDEAAPAEAL
jgi:hypothetical protein